ncbi:MAG: ECF transporter S component [Clostridiales bacterium]|jgi:ECF transporter S component (folate family)|nr:ECF transporter S component [Clostridiales bacterium]
MFKTRKAPSSGPCRENLTKITVSAMFTALALSMKLAFSNTFLIAGVPLLRVGLPTGFSYVPALFFGPVYGAAALAVTDFAGWALKPVGPWLPALTLTEALKGLAVGWAARRLREADFPAFRSAGAFGALYLKTLIAVGPASLAVTTLNTVILKFAYGVGGSKSFLVYFLPRIIETSVSVALMCYLLTLYQDIYRKFVQPYFRKI